MQNTDTPAGMLAVFDTIDPSKKELITPEDRAACQVYQQQCYDVLDELAAKHKCLCKEAEKFTDKYAITFKPNGTVEAQRLSDCEIQDQFINVRFLPFRFINDIAEKYHRTCGLFENLIIGYFAEKYRFTIAYPFSETDNIALGYHPDYNICINYIISQLGGLTFREKAEEEIIRRVLKTVEDFGRGVQPECLGDKIRSSGLPKWMTMNSNAESTRSPTARTKRLRPSAPVWRSLPKRAFRVAWTTSAVSTIIAFRSASGTICPRTNSWRSGSTSMAASMCGFQLRARLPRASISFDFIL